jgi:hypothetical protein
MGRFDQLDSNDQRLLSRIDDAFEGLLRALSDEAKEGPHLFSLVPVNRDKFNPREWTTAKFRLILWCEHSRLPLPIINRNRNGVYEFDNNRDWVNDAAPFLQALAGTLRLLLPVAFSAAELIIDEAVYKSVEKELDFGKECIDALLDGSEIVEGQLKGGDSFIQQLPRRPLPAHGAKLREFHTLLKKQDPTLSLAA